MRPLPIIRGVGIGPRRNDNEEIIHIPQSSKTAASPMVLDTLWDRILPSLQRCSQRILKLSLSLSISLSLSLSLYLSLSLFLYIYIYIIIVIIIKDGKKDLELFFISLFFLFTSEMSQMKMKAVW